MTSLKTSIKTITYLSDIGCLEIQGASLDAERAIGIKIMEEINQTLFTEIMENILLKKEVSSLMSAYWR